MANEKLDVAIILFKNEMQKIREKMEDFYTKNNREMLTFSLLNPEE